jgi:hypothetical protein
MEDGVESITGEMDLYAPIYTQHAMISESNRDFHPLAAIQPGGPIEVLVKAEDNHYFDLNDSTMTVLAQITKANGDPTVEHTVGPINLPLHSIFKEVTADLNGTLVSDTNNLYGYRSYFETALNFTKETQDTRLLVEGWIKDLAGKMDVANPAGDNTGLATREDEWNKSGVVQLIGRPHSDMFMQSRLIPPGLDLHMKFIPAAHEFVIMSAVNNENFKLVIKALTLTIKMKRLASEVELAHRELNRSRFMKLPYTRVQLKTLSIAANLTSVSFDTLFSGPLPDLMVIGLVSDPDYAGGYGRNPYNFRTFNVKKIELICNGISKPSDGYQPSWADFQYKKAYQTFQEQLGFGKGNQCVSLTPHEWANGYTFYVFKVTDGPIGSGTEGPRSRAGKGNIRLDIAFSAGNAENIKVIVYSQSFGLVEIDEFKRVIVS